MSEEMKPANEAAPAPAAAPTPTPAAAGAAPTPTVKTKMDPKKKKNIIIWSCVGGGVLIAAIVAIVLVIVLTKVDYKETFEAADAADDIMYEFRSDYDDCTKVVSQVDSTWKDPDDYESLIINCKSAASDKYIPIIQKVGNTSGIQRDQDLKRLYELFAEEFKKNTDSFVEGLDAKLDVYKNWHKFIYYADDLSVYTTGISDAKIDEVAGYAINSGNETIKNYGTEWATKLKAVINAYKEYRSDYKKYDDYSEKNKEFSKFVESNQPNITELIPLNFVDNYYSLDSVWDDLYDAVRKKYRDNNAASEATQYEKYLEELLK